MTPKQTAVEWFQEQIIKIVNGTCELSETQIFEQAKQMELEQQWEFANDYAKNHIGFSSTDPNPAKTYYQYTTPPKQETKNKERAQR